MTHPNDMSAWPEIACQRGHGQHRTRQVHLDIGGPTAYRDLAPIPRRFKRSFDMLIWDPAVYPVDGGPYCPAHDAVSETIATHRIWEPQETTLTLQVCSSAELGIVVDFGSQVGWFSLLAMSCFRTVHAYDADAEDVRILRASADLNGWGFMLDSLHARIDADTRPLPAVARIRLAKIDIEGAEDQAVRVLWPSIEAGLVDHLLIEISPVFADYYPDLVASLLDAGYDGYLLPEKRTPPPRLDVFPDDLEAGWIDPATARETVASWHQANCWFTRKGATW